MTRWILDETYDFRGQAVRHGVIGSGSPLVLVHGTPFSYVWHRIAPYLAERHEVVFFDLLGYGVGDARRARCYRSACRTSSSSSC